MVNVFIKPKGKLKGSQTMAAKGDHKSQGNPKSTSTNPKSKVMAKIMKQYPNKYGTPSPSSVVSANQTARDANSKAISQANSKRKLKYIGA